MPLPNEKEFKNDFSEVQELLFSSERKKIEVLEQKIESIREMLDSEFIHKNIKKTIKNNKYDMATILYPTLGPMIKKSVSESIKQIVATIDQIVERSFSIDGLRWRYQSFKSGIPLNEIILKNTIVFRVEHIFLVQRKTGDLLQHVVAPNAIKMDKSSFAGLAAAVTDFAIDVFDIQDHNRCQNLEIDDLTIWMDSSRDFYLAIVICGVPPLALRQKLTAVTDEIQEKTIMTPDKSAKELARTHFFDENLQPLLLEKIKSKNRFAGRAIFISIVISLSLSILNFFYQSHLKEKKQQQMNQYITELQKNESSSLQLVREEKIKFHDLLKSVTNLPVYDSQNGKLIKNIRLAVESITSAYFSTGKNNNFIIILHYQKGFENIARKLAKEINWRLYLKGILDYHFVRTLELPNAKSNAPIIMRLVQEETRQ